MPCRVGVRYKDDDCEVLSTGSPIVAVVLLHYYYTSTSAL